MKKSVAVRSITYFMIAILLLAVPMFVLLAKEKKTENMRVDILFLGDSLIGQYRDETSIPYLVGQALGKTTFNGAFGGSTMTWYPSDESDYYQRYGLNFPALAQAMCSGNFGVQKSLDVQEIGTEDFADVITGLERLEFDELEVLVLEYGTNDYFSGAQLVGNGDECSFEGSFVAGIELLQKSYPGLRIVVASPTFNWYYMTEQSCEQIEFGGGYMSDYITSLDRLCSQYQIEYIDLYGLYDHSLSIYEGNLYTEDGVHPNEYGRQVIAEEIVRYLTN